ncbi:MAG: MATE family efflux transporter [Thermoguttaceae bacterium]|nr:MATE family efflux transporter [Thermoguttaceae bacterium]MDW8077495.1 MATE family efflux transporter [Thermoguttaceae bacterium]
MRESETFLLLNESIAPLITQEANCTPAQIRRVIISLALPVLAEQVLAMLVGFSDRLLTGHFLETDHLAAITVIGYLLWLVYGVFSVFSMGTSAITARSIGARDYPQANMAFHHGLLLAVGLSLPATLAGSAFTPHLVQFMQLGAGPAKAATEYLQIIVPCIPLIAVQAVSVSCLRAAGDMVAGFLVMAIVNILNVLVSWALCLGWGPLPQLGWRGLAVGTATGVVGGTVVLVILLWRGRRGLYLPGRHFTWDPRLAWRILRVGIPGGADNLAVIGCQLWFLALINCLGSVATAAHGVALSIESLAFLPGIAIQAAASTLAGQLLGARRPEDAIRAVSTARNLGCLIMGGGGLLLIVFAPWLPFLFVSASQSAVAVAATPLLRIIGLGMVPLAVVMVTSSGIRGAGDTARTLAISLVGFLGVRIPATYLLALPGSGVPLRGSLPGLGLGVVGAWYAMVIDLTVRAFLLEIQFRRAHWTKIQI